MRKAQIRPTIPDAIQDAEQLEVSCSDVGMQNGTTTLENCLVVFLTN